MVAAHFPAGRLAQPIVATLPPGAHVRMSRTFLAGWALVAAGALIRRACYRELGGFFTFELAVRDDHRLVTTGPYRVVRHPSYAGGIMAALGLAMIMVGPGAWWSECVLPWNTAVGAVFNSLYVLLLSGLPMVFISRPHVEDKVLRAQFGKQWDEWAQRVPYRLVPGIY